MDTSCHVLKDEQESFGETGQGGHGRQRATEAGAEVGRSGCVGGLLGLGSA